MSAIISTAKVQPSIKRFNTGECPPTVNALLRFLEENMTLLVSLQTGIANGQDMPSVVDETFLWIREDATGRSIGLFVYNQNLAKYIIPGSIGELKTIIRSSATLAEDLVDKGLDVAWALADGSNLTIPDLTANPAFFQGASPDWDIYTIAYTGI